MMTMSQIPRSVSDIKRSHVKSGSLVLDVDKYGDEYEEDDHDLGGPAPFDTKPVVDHCVKDSC